MLSLEKYTLSDLYIYPVKSLGGISIKSSEVTERGLKYDRRWLLVDQYGKFITQRVYPQMALICVEIKDGKLEFNHRIKNEKFSLYIESKAGGRTEAVIWSDKVSAQFVNSTADEWFSEMIGVKCRMVYMPDDTYRPVDNRFAYRNEIVSFADAYPFLLIGQSSLDELNSRLIEKIPVNRFRPNLVFSGGNPFDEDRIKSFILGDVTFFSVKPCARCVVTTINQDTAEKNEEPLNTLSTYRKVNNKVMFGQNLLHKGCGSISVGSELKITAWK